MAGRYHFDLSVCFSLRIDVAERILSERWGSVPGTSGILSFAMYRLIRTSIQRVS
jgi:hypothetical protein